MVTAEKDTLRKKLISTCDEQLFKMELKKQKRENKTQGGKFYYNILIFIC